jgi:antitoxin component YwqK of YwqJK toxin-antitoxin module
MPKEIRTANWPQSGTRYWECEYEGDVAHGKFRSWHNDGKPFEEGEYVHGKRNGIWMLWSSDGRVESTFEMKDDLVVHKIKKRNGKIVEEKHYGPDGKPVEGKG